MQHLTVLELKQLIHKQIPKLPPSKQKLFCRNHGPLPMEDGRKLNSFHGLYNKSVINLGLESPWEIYLQAGDGKIHTVEMYFGTPDVSRLLMHGYL